jgi:hypothetical protein
MRQDPGEFMVEQAKSALPREKRERVPESVEATASSLLRVGYGTTGVWAAGYLAWLPRTRLMPPVTEQHAGQVILPLLQHAAFGVALVPTYDWLRRRFG